MYCNLFVDDECQMMIEASRMEDWLNDPFFEFAGEEENESIIDLIAEAEHLEVAANDDVSRDCHDYRNDFVLESDWRNTQTFINDSKWRL